MALNDIVFHISRAVTTTAESVSKISSAIAASALKPGEFYIVAPNDSSLGGVIALNGNPWYTLAGGVNTIKPIVENNSIYLSVETTSGATKKTEKLLVASGITGDASETKIESSGTGTAVSYTIKTNVLVEPLTATTTNYLQTISIDSFGKLDASVKLDYDSTTGDLVLFNSNGDKTKVNIPTKSVVEDGTFVKNYTEAKNWVNKSIYSASTKVIKIIDDTMGTVSGNVPSLILILHDIKKATHEGDTAMILPVSELIPLIEIDSSGYTNDVQLTYSGTAKHYNIEVRKDDLTIKQYSSATANGFSKAGIDAKELYVADGIFEDDITVSGVTVGSLINGDVITAGTSFVELVKKMLTKVNDVIVDKIPTAEYTITLSSASGSNLETYEVGDEIEYTFTNKSSGDGLFVGDCKEYAYSASAGCSISDEKIYKTPTSSETLGAYNGTRIVDKPGYYEFSLQGYYSSSTTIPKKSDGTNSSVNIPSGITETLTKGFNVAYKWYLGNTTGTTSADVSTTSATNMITGWTNDSGETVCDTKWVSDGTNIFAMAQGSLTTIKFIDMATGMDLTPYFTKFTVVVETGSEKVSTNYICYLMKVTNHAKVGIRVMIINK